MAVVVAVALFWPFRLSANEFPQSGPEQNSTQVTACSLLVGPGGEDLAVRRNICLLVAAGALPIMHWPDFTRWQPQAREFYDASAYSPAWLENEVPTPQALVMIDQLEAADEKGLQPQDYDGPRWNLRLERFNDAKMPPAADQAMFDVA
ncbi:MAG: hypothetical protein ACM3PW_00380, partial [Chlamydiota bacterium]